jgi:hypothetical protein
MRNSACLIRGAAPKTLGFIAVGPESLYYFGAASTAPAIPAPESALGVAVETSITARPPRRSVRAELPHTALPLDTGVEAHIRIGMKSTWSRDPQLEDRPQIVPIWFPSLTASA